LCVRCILLQKSLDINAPHAVGLHSVDLDVCIT
jgi:hypothetical protein